MINMSIIRSVNLLKQESLNLEKKLKDTIFKDKDDCLNERIVEIILRNQQKFAGFLFS